MRSLVMLICLFALTCSNADADPKETELPSKSHPDLKWSEGPDDAMVAMYKDVAAYKCWPVKGGYDCLQAVDLRGPDEVAFDAAVAFTRGTVAKLPNEPFATLVPASYARYSCSIRNGTMTEQISSNDHTLTESSSDFPPTYSGPWSVDFVNDFTHPTTFRG